MPDPPQQRSREPLEADGPPPGIRGDQLQSHLVSRLNLVGADPGDHREVAKLDPKPGRNFSGDDAQYITPDVFVYKMQTTGDAVIVALNRAEETATTASACDASGRTP